MHILFSVFQETGVLDNLWMFILILTKFSEDNFSTAQLSKLYSFFGCNLSFPYVVNCFSVVLIA